MQLRNVDLNLLKALDVLMDERSVTKAAIRLSLTQPALSATLNRLRDALNDPLLVRTQRGLTPTPRAIELVQPVKRILADIEAVLQTTEFDPASAAFTLRLAATDYALRAVVVPFMAALRPMAPGIRIAVVHSEAHTLLERMERGELDLALVTPDMAPSTLHSRTLYEERYVCVLREGHPFASPRKLSLNRFCSLEHGIVSLSGGGFSGPTDKALERLGRRRRVMASVPSFVMLLDLVRSSDLVAVVPRRLLKDTPGLHVMQPPLDIPGFTKILAWHARTHADAGQRWAREQLLRICATLP
jgi:DNA-binding transcriptional LysR family regulator